MHARSSNFVYFIFIRQQQRLKNESLLRESRNCSQGKQSRSVLFVSYFVKFWGHRFTQIPHLSIPVQTHQHGTSMCSPWYGLCTHALTFLRNLPNIDPEVHHGQMDGRDQNCGMTAKIIFFFTALVLRQPCTRIQTTFCSTIVIGSYHGFSLAKPSMVAPMYLTRNKEFMNTSGWEPDQDSMVSPAVGVRGTEI